MKQLPLLKEIEPAPASTRSPVKLNLTRERLARLDYEMTCPLAFIGQTSFCHNCALFAGGEIDLTTPSVQVTLRCHGEKYTGSQYAFKPGNIHHGWKSTPAWIEQVYD